MVKPNDMRVLVHASPFKPFILFHSDQRKFSIKHPDFLWVIPGGRSIGVADENGTVEIIDLLHVSSIRLNGSDELAA